MQMVHKNYTIVGVAAPRFTWDDADVYVPQKITQDPTLVTMSEFDSSPA